MQHLLWRGVAAGLKLCAGAKGKEDMADGRGVRKAMSLPGACRKDITREVTGLIGWA